MSPASDLAPLCFIQTKIEEGRWSIYLVDETGAIRHWWTTRRDSRALSVIMALLKMGHLITPCEAWRVWIAAWAACAA